VASPRPRVRCTRCVSTITDGRDGIVLLRGYEPVRVLCSRCADRHDEQHTASVPIDRYLRERLTQGGLDEAMSALHELNALRPDVVLAATYIEPAGR
jgi:hypothetical protein